MGGKANYEERRRRRIERYEKVREESEKRNKKLRNKTNDKSMKSSEKSENFRNRVEHDNAIFHKDSQAILKLQEKLKKLENIKKEMSMGEYETYELRRVKAEIRETKLRINRLTEGKNKNECISEIKYSQ